MLNTGCLVEGVRNNNTAHAKKIPLLLSIAI